MRSRNQESARYRCTRCGNDWAEAEVECSRCLGDKREEIKVSSNIRTRSTDRYYCYRCGTPWPDQELFCPGCGGNDRAEGSAKPSVEVKGDIEFYQGPWAMIPWPRQGSVAIFGGPGSGKSSVSALVDPKHWITKEQEPKPVGAMFRRLTPGKMPPIHAANTAEDVSRILSVIHEGPIVLDSLTAFGLRDALVVAHMLVNWAQDHDDRVLAILQVNKDGASAGYMEIPHLFDANINLSPDPWGVRSFRVLKSRWCSLEAVYWHFDNQGQVSVPDFPAAYSVEGSPGDYSLHPFPVKGARWNGLLHALNAGGKLRPRLASAAHVANYMPTGFMVPQDHHERRRFAERNQLDWIEPEEAIALLVDDFDEEQPISDAFGEE